MTNIITILASICIIFDFFIRYVSEEQIYFFTKPIFFINIFEIIILLLIIFLLTKKTSIKSKMKLKTLFSSETKPETIDFKTSQPNKILKDIQYSSDTEDIELTNIITIDSPVSGNFYSSPNPGKPHFVNRGDTVKSGDTICIVEVMKLINEISASIDCTIVKILVKDGEYVVKGQSLMVIQKL